MLVIAMTNTNEDERKMTEAEACLIFGVSASKVADELYTVRYVAGENPRHRRIRWYFQENPNELEFAGDYGVHGTADYHFLGRSPGGRRGWERLGTEIGADTYQGKVLQHVYLYRERKVGAK